MYFYFLFLFSSCYRAANDSDRVKALQSFPAYSKHVLRFRLLQARKLLINIHTLMQYAGNLQPAFICPIEDDMPAFRITAQSANHLIPILAQLWISRQPMQTILQLLQICDSLPFSPHPDCIILNVRQIGERTVRKPDLRAC